MRDDETQVHIEARPTDRGPFEVVAFDGKAVRVLHERADRGEAVELAEAYVGDERFKHVKVEVAS